MIAFGLFLFSCNNVSTNTTQNPIDTSVSIPERHKDNKMLELAKSYVDSSTQMMKKGFTKEVNKSKSQKEVSLYMDSVFAISKRMQPNDTLQLHDYRLSELNKMLDWMVANGYK